MLGLELLERTATAVAVGPDGRVLARAERVSAGASLAEVAVAAVRQVMTAPGLPVPATLGLAALDPSAHDPTVAALAAAFGGALASRTVWPSGAAAAIAETWCGAARGARDVVLFSIGRRTAAGILKGGEVWKGAHGLAGAVAWLALNPVEREDYRKLGCLEAEIGAAGIVRRLVWRIKAGDRSRVLDAAGGELGAITVELVLHGARTGDGVAISVVRDTAKYVGMAAANLVVTVDPEVLVLGGIMADAGDLLLEPVRAEILRRLPASLGQMVRIELATLGDDAPAIGASRLAASAIT